MKSDEGSVPCTNLSWIESNLQRSVRRWRLACFALAIIVVSLLAIGGTFGALMLLELPGRQHMLMMQEQVDAERARAEAMQAEARAERDQAERARRQAEDALRAERAARQRPEAPQNGP